MTQKGSAFLICPVRGVPMSETEDIVKQLEADGWKVHWPPRDTPQDDLIGLDICTINMQAILAADVVFVIWDGKSQGCLFDLGMAFAFKKHISVLRLPEDVTPGKSFPKMILQWEMFGFKK